MTASFTSTPTVHPPFFFLIPTTFSVSYAQEAKASSAEPDSTPAQDPNDRAIGGARTRRPLGGAATDVTPAAVGADGGDGVVPDSAATADVDDPAAPAVGAKPWQRKKRVAAVRKKPSVDDGAEGAAMGDAGVGEARDVDSTTAKPWQRKRRPVAASATAADEVTGESGVELGEGGGEEEAAAPAKPWKSRAKPSRANQPAKPWQKRAPSGGAGDGEGRDAGEVEDLSNGGIEAAPAEVTKPSGNGEGGRGSVDELEAALEHREWKRRLAVFKVRVLFPWGGSKGYGCFVSLQFGSGSIGTPHSVYACTRFQGACSISMWWEQGLRLLRLIAIWFRFN